MSVEFPIGIGWSRKEWTDRINQVILDYQERSQYIAIGYIFPFDERVEVDTRTTSLLRAMPSIDPDTLGVNPCSEIWLSPISSESPGSQSDYAEQYKRRYIEPLLL